MALMGNAEVVVAGQQDKMLSINIIRGSVMKKVRMNSFHIRNISVVHVTYSTGYFSGSVETIGGD